MKRNRLDLLSLRGPLKGCFGRSTSSGVPPLNVVTGTTKGLATLRIVLFFRLFPRPLPEISNSGFSMSLIRTGTGLWGPNPIPLTNSNLESSYNLFWPSVSNRNPIEFPSFQSVRGRVSVTICSHPDNLWRVGETQSLVVRFRYHHWSQFLSLLEVIIPSLVSLSHPLSIHFRQRRGERGGLGNSSRELEPSVISVDFGIWGRRDRPPGFTVLNISRRLQWLYVGSDSPPLILTSTPISKFYVPSLSVLTLL